MKGLIELSDDDLRAGLPDIYSPVEANDGVVDGQVLSSGALGPLDVYGWERVKQKGRIVADLIASMKTHVLPSEEVEPQPPLTYADVIAAAESFTAEREPQQADTDDEADTYALGLEHAARSGARLPWDMVEARVEDGERPTSTTPSHASAPMTSPAGLTSGVSRVFALEYPNGLTLDTPTNSNSMRPGVKPSAAPDRRQGRTR
jgi:hypothetical protein